MSENNQKEEIELSYSIHIKKFPEELIKILQDNHIKFQVWENQELKEDYDDPEEELPLVEVDLEIYQKLKKLSEITLIPIVEIVSKELGDFFYSVGDIPVIFLDRHLGIENIEKPIKMLKNLKALLHISERYLESLKTKEDLLKEIEEWDKPFKNIKK